MKIHAAIVPYVWRNLARRPTRTLLTVAGIAVATFLFAFVEVMTFWRYVATSHRRSAPRRGGLVPKIRRGATIRSVFAL